MKEDQNVVFILDNCLIHRKKDTRYKMKQSMKKILFIPSFSPGLALVGQAFTKLKRYEKIRIKK